MNDPKTPLTPQNSSLLRQFWLLLQQWVDSDYHPEGAEALRAQEDRVDWKRCVPFIVLHLGCFAVLWVGVSWVAVVAAVLLLVVLSTPIGARLLTAPLEQRSLPLASVTGSGAQAIVILGAGRLHKAPDAGGNDLPSTHTLMRLRHGARLHRQTGWCLPRIAG